MGLSQGIYESLSRPHLDLTLSPDEARTGSAGSKDAPLRAYTRTSSLELCLRAPTFLDHGVNEGANATTNPDTHVVSILKELRGLLDEANALGRTRHDD